MSSLADRLVDLAFATTTTNAARIEAWKEQLEVDPPRFDGGAVKEALGGARNVLIALAKRKMAAPLEPVGTPADVEAAEQHIASANRVLTDYNAAVAVIAAKVADFKK